MAKLQEIADKINTLHGDMTFRKIMEKKLDYLALGRRGNHEFVVRTNMRTLRSGPNRGKVRVDGAVITMYGKRHRNFVEASLVRNSEKLLPTLDIMITELNSIGE
jgi:hypothetical protein